jgi:hypothetical protein
MLWKVFGDRSARQFLLQREIVAQQARGADQRETASFVIDDYAYL